MNHRYFFSVIVPVYRVEKYLSQCVESLLSQDFDDYEIILVDDGSPDSCPVICDNYESKSSKVKVVHKSNGGLSDARNAGVAVAQGRYITFVDSDDFWRSNDVLSGIYKIIEGNNSPDIIVSDFIKFYDQTNKYLEPMQTCSDELNGKSKQEILEYLYFCHADMKISACQKFVKHELLVNTFFEKGLLSEDIDWSFKIYPKAKSIAVYPKPYYCYRQQREGSITNTISKRSFDSLVYILDKWNKKIPFLSIPKEEKEIYLGYLAYQLAICMALYNNLERNIREDYIDQLKKHEDLFKHKLNNKTISVYRLVRVFGLKTSCHILGTILKMRNILKL